MKQDHWIFFGPLCGLLMLIKKDEFWLNKLNLEVTSNEEIIQLEKVLKEKLTYSLLLLDNSHYNQYVSEGQKLSCMKANLYNQATINVIQRISYPISMAKTIDAFLAPKNTIVI